MPKELSLGNVKVKQGETKKGTLGTVGMPDGTCVPIPLVVVRGAKDGPTLVVTAGVHGTEISGIRALHMVLRSLDPSQLSGTLVAVPASNPIAVGLGHYTTWVDGENLSSTLSKASPDEGTTARVADIVWRAVNLADYQVDMHANPLPSMPFVLTNRVACKDEQTVAGVMKIAGAFGTTVINWDRPGQSMRDLCASRGIPAITVELPGNIYYWDEFGEIGARGLRNLMRSINMLRGQLEPQVSGITRVEGDLEYFGRLRAGAGGLMHIRYKPGQKIQKGATAVEIYDLHGDPVFEVKMPCTGYCWSFTGGGAGSAAVAEGVPIAYVFRDKRDAV